MGDLLLDQELRVCFKCGGIGELPDGSICLCQNTMKVDLPVILDIPEQYQAVVFDRELLPKYLHTSYGSVLSGLIQEMRQSGKISGNVCICSPPNSGKTIFAHTMQKESYNKHNDMYPMTDLNEVRKMMFDKYNYSNDDYKRFVSSKTIIVKLPIDLISSFAETIITLLNLRVGKGGTTILLYDGTKRNLLDKDKSGLLTYIIGDGKYHTIRMYSYSREENDYE